MKSFRLIATSLCFAFSTATFAHAPAEGTVPEDGAILDAVPDMLHLSLRKPARVVKVTMRHEDDSEIRLEPPSNAFAE